MYGLGADDLTQVMGIGYLGEVRQGPDGNLYEWVQGIDGLGNPFGLWRGIRRYVKRSVQPFLRRALPWAQQMATAIPGYGPAIAAGIKAATPILRQAGVAGYPGLGALYQAPDGSLYQMAGYAGDEGLDGLEADDELGYFMDADELSGFAGDGWMGMDGLGALYQAPDGSLYQMAGYADFAGDDALDGLEADDELGYFNEAEELAGYAGEAELEGLQAEDELGDLSDDEVLGSLSGDDELNGYGEADEMAGYGESDELGDLDGYVLDRRLNGLEAYVPDQPAGTSPFTGQTPQTWKTIW
jgi:hypothetical protein